MPWLRLHEADAPSSRSALKKLNLIGGQLIRGEFDKRIQGDHDRTLWAGGGIALRLSTSALGRHRLERVFLPRQALP